MSWQVVPESEIPKMIEAIKDGRCCTCYKPIVPNDGGNYCYACDPRDFPSETKRESAYRVQTVKRHFVTHVRFYMCGDHQYETKRTKGFNNARGAARWLAKQELRDVAIGSCDPVSKDEWLKAYGELFPCDPACNCCYVYGAVLDWDKRSYPGERESIGEKAFCCKAYRAYLAGATQRVLDRWEDAILKEIEG